MNKIAAKGVASNLRAAAASATRSRRPPRGADAKTPRTKKSLATQERILDAAEELFAQHGLYGVTIREVARHAGVDTALLHYYFGTKNGLFDAVLLRRAEPLNEERTKALERCEALRGRVTVEAALDAFVGPVFDALRKGGRGWQNYCALVAQVNNMPVRGGEIMTRFFDPVVLRLIALLRRALPGVRDKDLFWGYNMFTGALTLTISRTGRIDRLSRGTCRSHDLDAAEKQLIAYGAAGFRNALRDA
ncbi:MAG: TetR/AcrR family transcriptional regulator [Rudaea sp.]